MLQAKEDLEKARLKRLLHEKRFQKELLIATAGIATGCIVTNNVSRGIAFGSVIPRIFIMRNLYKMEAVKERQELLETLRTTATYSELKAMYDEYIKDVAKLIRFLNLKSAKEVLIYLQGMMENGFFSTSFDHKYKIYKNEFDYVEELYGAKVITGKSVCRHMSSFFCDVLNELNYTAANVTCAINRDDPFKQMRRNKVIPNHSVTGVVDRGEKLIFDPTGGVFAVVPTTLDNQDDYFIHVSEVLGDEKKYIIMCPSLENNNFGREDKLEKLNSTKLSKMSKYEFEYLFNQTMKVLEGSHFFLMDFFARHQKQSKDIEALYKELSPYSDEPIRKWLVRK